MTQQEAVQNEIAERAGGRMEMDKDRIGVTARCGGVSHAVTVPISAGLAIYARETGQGMALPDDVGGNGEQAQSGVAAAADAAEPATGGQDDDEPPPRRGGHLRVLRWPPGLAGRNRVSPAPRRPPPPPGR